MNIKTHYLTPEQIDIAYKAKNSSQKLRQVPYLTVKLWETKNKQEAIIQLGKKINIYHKDFVKHILGNSNEKITK